jgi:3-oxoadipate enol-lactonase
MILLHAFPLDGSMWDGYAGTPVDHPGSGSLAEWADLVAQRIDGRDVVVGISMGGYAAFELARRHPERLSGLVLASTRPTADPPDMRAARDANIKVASREGSAALFERVAPTLFRPDPDPAVVERARAVCERQPPARLVAMLESLRDRADCSDALSGIDVPTVVVVGEHDAIRGPEPAPAWAARMPDARVVEIPAAGHLCALEQPRAFADACRLVAGASGT